MMALIFLLVKNTRLSYLVFPDIGTDYNLSANDPNYAYDFEYTSMYSAIDLGI